MPITPLYPVSPISQEEFRELSYVVMGHVFEIHNEFGRFFDERIYTRELARRMPEVELEFPIQVSNGPFVATYHVDALVARRGPFEFKAAEVLTPRHRNQLYNYLLLLDLAHGKLVNMRPESVCHEFINATIRQADRHVFELDTERWNGLLEGAEILLEYTVSLLRDWGAGLDLSMYETALTSLLGGEDRVVKYVAVRDEHHVLGRQWMRFAAEDVAFRLTAFQADTGHFEVHVRRLLRHVDVRAILWVNIAFDRVSFTSIERESV